MKAFISYSMKDRDQYVLTLLASKLRQQNFFVSSNQNFYSSILDNVTRNEIHNANLFIGIITSNDRDAEKVIQEWKLSVKDRIPNILLIEKAVAMNENFTGNYLRFDRYDPEPAINEINHRMNRSVNNQKNTEALSWILGGAALLAIISALSKK